MENHILQTDATRVRRAALATEIEHLKGLLANQAHAMADADYHFSILWFAAQKQDWPLANFYIAEPKSHLEWAVRIRPVRKLTHGQELDLISRNSIASQSRDPNSPWRCG